MVVKNAVGGWFHLVEFNIKLGPNQVIDLDFICSREQQQASKELKRAISRKFVTIETAQTIPQQHIQTLDIVSFLTQKTKNFLRKAVFLRVDTPIDPPWDLFVMRDTDSKLAMVKLATDVTLLGTIIKEEQDAVVIQAAHVKLQELVEHNL